MKRANRSLVLGGVLAAASAIVVGPAIAGDPPAAPACPPMQKKIEHPFLVAMVGDWNATFTAVDPTGKKVEGTATSHIALGVLGTALIEDYAAADMGGGPFAGHGITKISDDGKTVTTWWLDGMTPEPMKLSGPLTDTTLEMSGTIPGMGTMRIVSKKVDGGLDWDATIDGKPMMSQKYRRAK